MSSMSLNEYLKHAKDHLRDAIANEKHISLVMGNENAGTLRDMSI